MAGVAAIATSAGIYANGRSKKKVAEILAGAVPAPKL
jgi:hypothetical protein